MEVEKEYLAAEDDVVMGETTTEVTTKIRYRICKFIITVMDQIERQKHLLK